MTPWTAACWGSLTFTISQSLLTLMPVETWAVQYWSSLVSWSFSQLSVLLVFMFVWCKLELYSSLKNLLYFLSFYSPNIASFFLYSHHEVPINCVIRLFSHDLFVFSFGRKVISNIDSILKSGDNTSPTKFYLVKAMVFPVVMCGCESWTIKKSELRRIDAFELWCWRRLLRVPWTARRYNQSILKEISPEYSLEGLMLKLKLWYFGHLMWRTDSFEKTLMLGKTEGRRRRGQQRMRLLDVITELMDMSLSKPWEMVIDREA